ncbi:MAG: hypothetical protein SOW59_01115 [Corynebacterium sp.]|nr:hypothetical protein [Corynebacterium sp.]
MEQRRMQLDGHERKYIVIPPFEADPTTPRDLVLFFHGSMQSPGVIRRFTNGTFDALSHRGAVVVYPGGVKNHFNDARANLPEKTRELGVDDVKFTQVLVAQMRKEFAIARVFACGYSNGGQMVLRLLIDAPGLLSGAAIFAATLPADDNFAANNPLSSYQPTPVIFFHGTKDWLSPYEGGVAGLDQVRTRGRVISAPATVQKFAELNDAGAAIITRPYSDVEQTLYPGENPVALWTLEGVGHVIPSGNELDPRLGPNTTSFIAAEAVAEFFKL